MNEADVTKTHAAKIDALNRLAASLIRSGAPADAVKKFVDAELDRIEFMQASNERLPSGGYRTLRKARQEMGQSLRTSRLDSRRHSIQAKAGGRVGSNRLKQVYPNAG